MEWVSILAVCAAAGSVKGTALDIAFETIDNPGKSKQLRCKPFGLGKGRYAGYHKKPQGVAGVLLYRLYRLYPCMRDGFPF
jgi:hypothetical protein